MSNLLAAAFGFAQASLASTIIVPRPFEVATLFKRAESGNGLPESSIAHVAAKLKQNTEAVTEALKGHTQTLSDALKSNTANTPEGNQRIMEAAKDAAETLRGHNKVLWDIARTGAGKGKVAPKDPYSWKPGEVPSPLGGVAQEGGLNDEDYVGAIDGFRKVIKGALGPNGVATVPGQSPKMTRTLFDAQAELSTHGRLTGGPIPPELLGPSTGGTISPGTDDAALLLGGE